MTRTNIHTERWETSLSRLAEAGLVTLTWSEDEEGNVFAEGLAEYEIDLNNELAVFHGDECVKVHDCVDLCHAASIVGSHEAVLRWNIKNGRTGNGWKVTEKGWPTKERARG